MGIGNKINDLNCLVALLAAAAAGSARASEPAGGGGAWESEDTIKGIVVRSRPVPGTGLREFFAEATLVGTVSEFQAVATDVERFRFFMPYVTESRRVLREPDGSEISYILVRAPIVDARDYYSRGRVLKEPDPDGNGEFHNTWEAIPTYKPERRNVVRLLRNDGFWRTRPAGDDRIQVQHGFITDPGGSVPLWIANRANVSGVPDLFNAIQAEMLRRRTQAGGGVGGPGRGNPAPRGRPDGGAVDGGSDAGPRTDAGPADSGGSDSGPHRSDDARSALSDGGSRREGGSRD